MKWLRTLFGTSSAGDAAHALYSSAVLRSRRPGFYSDWGVPDTVEGRFDMIVLHVYLLLRRLKGQGKAADAVGQALFDLMFRDMDQNLREMGMGDVKVAKRIKDMVSSFYGRIGSYDAALAADETDAGVLEDALRRNVYRGAAGDAQALAGYVRAETARIEGLDLNSLIAGLSPFDEDGGGSR